MIGRNPGWYWRTCWGILTPLIMVVILLYTLISYKPLKYKDTDYPSTAYGEFHLTHLPRLLRKFHISMVTYLTGANEHIYLLIFNHSLLVCPFVFALNWILAVGWTITAMGLIQLPLWAVIAVIKQKGDTLSEKIRSAFRPSPKWGPKDPVTLEKYQKYIANWRNEITANPPRNILQKIKQNIYGWTSTIYRDFST